MENSVRKLDEKYIEYKQNQAEAIMEKKEALKCADDLLLTAVELLEFAGHRFLANILENVADLIDDDSWDIK